ncbi:plasmid mobilization protein [Sphingobacterium siyangense]|uniref:plasmid mobilization protein n=1 Tax=Sphingobacterium siyangense TaxID=459529 RepID=UPI003DA521C7
MARPTKYITEKRHIMFRVRLTASEKCHLETLASEAGFTASDYLRMVVLSQAPIRRKPTPDRALLLSLLAEANKLGNNVNQIAHSLNMAERSGQPHNIPKRNIEDAMAELQLLSEYLLTTLKDGHTG